MHTTYTRLHALTLAVLCFAPITAGGCDFADEPTDPLPEQALEAQPITLEVEARELSKAELIVESQQLLYAATGAESVPANCTIETFQERVADDQLAITGPPNSIWTPFPVGIPELSQPGLEDGYFFSFTMRDIHDDVVGFASEQEIVDLINNESDTTWTVTVPTRGTLIMTQRESFQVLIDEIDDMVANQDLVRVYNPPLIELLTIPGTGKVAGGTGDFANAGGVMIELGVIYEIDLINNEFDVGGIVHALVC